MPVSAPAPVPGLDLLGGDDAAVALVAPAAHGAPSPRSVSYGELRARVAARADELGAERRLLLLPVANELEPIVTLIAAMRGGHPVVLAPADGDRRSERFIAELVDRFDPDTVGGGSDRGWRIEHRRSRSAHALHPELAMLGSTSGSTGSPKLVRISRTGLVSNADAIGEYLGIRADDRAATTLPLHYCYGLSVLTSHLRAGASLWLTDRSVAEPGFWREFAEHRATSFAGVPYTFELLDRGRFAERVPPSLRTVTQAGGRLDPVAVRRYAELGRERGFDFFVMYGQTEATARMAYLPPELAIASAGAIGRAIPGGELRIAEPDERGVGELVYAGPNVMMGYAESPADLVRGPELAELRTGDLARRRDDGLFEIVGRASRFVKPFGLRIDLDRVEALLEAAGHPARATGDDRGVVVLLARDRGGAEARAGAARELVARETGLPEHAISVHVLDVIPRTASGKPDYAAMRVFAAQQAEAAGAPGAPDAPGPSGARRPHGGDARPEVAQAGVAGVGIAVCDTPALAAAIRDLYASLLGRPDAGLGDSFTELGGDSLSFIEVSIRLEGLLGSLPRDWPALTPRDLASRRETAGPAAAGSGSPTTPGPIRARPARARGRRLPRVETAALLRAAGIVLIVGTHADLFSLKGGAHLLLAVAGFNLARFQLAAGSGVPRRLLRSALALVVPAVVWIGAVAMLTGFYRPTTALLVNNLVPGDGRWNEQWQFWFLEAVVWSLLGLAALLAVPAVARLERRRPFGFALAILAVALAARYLVVGVPATGTGRYSIVGVVWCLALGWAVARAGDRRRRVLVTAIAAATVPGFFGEPWRELVILVGVAALIWLPAVPLPRAVAVAIAWLGGASMYVYLTHWQFYPPFEQSAPWFGTLLSFAIGIAVWKAVTAATSRLSGLLRDRRGAGGGPAEGESGSSLTGREPRAQAPVYAG